MNITIGMLHYVAKRLQSAAYNAAVSTPVEPPLTRGELSVLEYLVAQTEAKSIRDIVAGTGLVQSWVSTVAKSLGERKWVVIAQDEKDKRVTTVKATAEVIEGSKLALHSYANAALSELTKNASNEELEVITNGLDTLYRLLNKNEEDDLALTVQNRNINCSSSDLI